MIPRSKIQQPSPNLKGKKTYWKILNLLVKRKKKKKRKRITLASETVPLHHLDDFNKKYLL